MTNSLLTRKNTSLIVESSVGSQLMIDEVAGGKTLDRFEPERITTALNELTLTRNLSSFIVESSVGSQLMIDEVAGGKTLD